MSDKINIEDMTLGQIRELKEKLKQRVCYAVKQVLMGFEEDYGIKSEVSSLWAGCDTIESEQGTEITHNYYVRADVHLDGEDL